MPDWTKSMQQTFEYYVVDPNTWKDKAPIRSVLSSKISRDLSAETQGSFSLTVTEPLGECYVRVYMVTNQNGIKERFPMGTYLIQTPAYGFDGKVKNITLDAYTPLLELKENQPPLGYSILEGENIMDIAYRLIRENGRAPVVSLTDNTKLFFDFVANTDDTWMTFLNDLIANAKFSLGLDELGRVIFNPIQTVNSMQPIWTYDDTNSSILYPEIEVKQDLYGIPNVVEVIFSSNKQYQYVKVVNDDPNSPTSTINRGREITHRVTNPSTLGNPTVEQLKEYGTQVLKELSSLEYRITYKHGYCPVRIGDCVRLNYEKAGLVNVKAKVISQSIDCVPGCPVSETAIYTNQLWG
jgi:hypothetical protein